MLRRLASDRANCEGPCCSSRSDLICPGNGHFACSTRQCVPKRSRSASRVDVSCCSHSQRTSQGSVRQVRRQRQPSIQQLTGELHDAIRQENFAEAARLRDAIKQQEDANPLHQLQQQLKQAIAEERFKEAAVLRDEIIAATPVRPPTESDTTTDGVRVQVKSMFMRTQSAVNRHAFIWSYKIKITNLSERTVTLQNRHWIISHDDGHNEEVRGPGVVGEKPTLAPNQSFSYSSYCQMQTPRGTMEGSYEFMDVTPDAEHKGRLFDVIIGKFGLDSQDAAAPTF